MQKSAIIFGLLLVCLSATAQYKNIKASDISFEYNANNALKQYSFRIIFQNTFTTPVLVYDNLQLGNYYNINIRFSNVLLALEKMVGGVFTPVVPFMVNYGLMDYMYPNMDYDIVRTPLVSGAIKSMELSEMNGIFSRSSNGENITKYRFKVWFRIGFKYLPNPAVENEIEYKESPWYEFLPVD